MRISLYHYLGIFLISALLCAYVGLMHAMTVRAMKCDQSDRPDDAFAFYCNDAGFADYEHGAFYYGYEPRTLQSLMQADVVMLGNSRLMYAMAPGYGEEYLQKHGVRHYQFGFGYKQRSDFPLALIKRYKLHPKVLIINVDPFFEHNQRGPAKDILSGSFLSFLEYRAKRNALVISCGICKAWPPVCPRQGSVLYRSYETGRWHIPASAEGLSFTRNDIPVPDASLDQAAAVAEDFLSAVPTPRHCIILTGIPSPTYNSEFAVLLAKKLGTRVINVTPDPVTLRDQHHLDTPTALAWQKEFLPKALPVIRECLALK